jgi:hypothetical protein
MTDSFYVLINNQIKYQTFGMTYEKARRLATELHVRNLEGRHEVYRVTDKDEIIGVFQLAPGDPAWECPRHGCGFVESNRQSFLDHMAVFGHGKSEAD